MEEGEGTILKEARPPEFDNDRESKWPFPTTVFQWLLERVREVEPDRECVRLWLPCRPTLLEIGLGGGVDRGPRSGSRWDIQPVVACPDPSPSWV